MMFVRMINTTQALSHYYVRKSGIVYLAETRNIRPCRVVY
jgi:hypothetical protein